MLEQREENVIDSSNLVELGYSCVDFVTVASAIVNNNNVIPIIMMITSLEIKVGYRGEL